MGGKKGRSGRPKNFDDEYHRICRKLSLEYYYKHKDRRKKSMQKYHKKNVDIMKYAKKHGISIPEARKRLAKEKEK